MLTIQLDTDQLSTEELANLAYVLHERCALCIAHNVPIPCRHDGEVHDFLERFACTLDGELCLRERAACNTALGIETRTGDWPPGA